VPLSKGLARRRRRSRGAISSFNSISDGGSTRVAPQPSKTNAAGAPRGSEGGGQLGATMRGQRTKVRFAWNSILVGGNRTLPPTV